MPHGAPLVGDMIYRQAGLDPAMAARGGAIGVCLRIFGGGIIHEEVGAPQEWRLEHRDGRPRIVLRAGLDPRQAHFFVGRALAQHFVGARATVDGARAVAAWLVAPTPAFRVAYAEVGEDVGRLADWFAVTRTVAALRIGEAIGTSVAVVTAEKVVRRARGILECLPDADLRALALGRREPRSVRRALLREDRRAVALLAG